jgi:hypothetical protein
MKLLINAGVFVLAVLLLASVIVITLDGRAFQLPNNRTVFIYDYGFHIYKTEITYEYRAEEE